MLTTTPLKISPANQAELHHLSTILHLIHHRNHNQHRRSTWYRTFSLLRRHLNHLLADLATLSEVPSTHLARHRKKATDRVVEARIQARVEFWRDVLVPKAQHAFSQLVADQRFAVVGVVLMACLAQIGKIVGLLAVYEEMGQREVEMVLERFAKEEWDAGDAGVVEERGGLVEDFGEVLERQSPPIEEPAPGSKKAKNVTKDRVLQEMREQNTLTSPSAHGSRESSCIASPIESAPQQKATSKTKSSSKASKRSAYVLQKPLKKKKKKGNAIDDLFSGL